MFIEELTLENFRNYPKLNISFNRDKPITVFVGQNAQGKTNLLESIFFLGRTKSFRPGKAYDLLTWDRPHGRVKATVNRDNENQNLELFVSKDEAKKYHKLSDQVVTKTKYTGNLYTVLFTPDDLNMILLEPGLRRKYLDNILTQTDKRYFINIINYSRTLRQRNALLRNNEPGQLRPEEVELWDAKLVEFGQPIMDKRREYIDFVQERMGEVYRSISETDDKVTATYKPSTDNFAESLLENRQKDMRFARTSCGPHRDDLVLTINGQSLSETGSRGEIRSTVLALKMIEIEYFYSKLGIRPILLLDDVFSELDHTRQHHLIEIALEHQTFITTTCKEHLEGFQDKISMYNVLDGELTKLG